MSSDFEEMVVRFRVSNSKVMDEFGLEVFNILRHKDFPHETVCGLCNDLLPYSSVTWDVICYSCFNQIEADYEILKGKIDLSITEHISNILLAKRLSQYE